MFEDEKYFPVPYRNPSFFNNKFCNNDYIFIRINDSPFRARITSTSFNKVMCKRRSIRCSRVVLGSGNWNEVVIQLTQLHNLRGSLLRRAACLMVLKSWRCQRFVLRHDILRTCSSYE